MTGGPHLPWGFAGEEGGECGVVAGYVVVAGAQREPAGPVDVARVEDIEFTDRADHRLHPVR